jgi:hypothetical protein
MCSARAAARLVRLEPTSVPCAVRVRSSAVVGGVAMIHTNARFFERAAHVGAISCACLASAKKQPDNVGPRFDGEFSKNSET